MATFTINDTIFATVSAGTSTILNRTLSGAASINDAIRIICRELAGHIGLVTVYLRNSTQGWLEKRVVRLTARHPASAPATPVQLSLF